MESNHSTNTNTKTKTAAKARRASPPVVAPLVWRWLAMVVVALLLLLLLLLSADSADPMIVSVSAFQSPYPTCSVRTQRTLLAGQIGEPEAKKAIDKVVQALRKDSSAKSELGNLKKVENVLGYGSPRAGTIAVRFNASFAKGGKGFLGMGGGKAKDGDQRGTMVGQVKASVDEKSGKVLECSVFRDLGYGRSFNLKT